ncbi:MAG: TetR family transcriptional regulator [Acidobacteria bacterium]|nr:TetR family transcriptional regulator [Acidobacteriota bacterium]
MGQKRARQIHEKESRRQDILGAALRAWEASSFAAVTMNQVAEEAHLAKGTLYLYFPTKESLFLGLAEEELLGFFEELDEALGRGRSPLGPGEGARLLSESLTRRPQLLRLLALLHATLEPKLEPLAVLRFRHFLATRYQRSGRLLERRMNPLPEGEGAPLLLQALSLAVALWQWADPAPGVRQVQGSPGLEVFRVAFPESLDRSLEALFLGVLLQAAPNSAGPPEA